LSINVYESVFGEQKTPLIYSVKVDGVTKYTQLSQIQGWFYYRAINLGPGHRCALYKGKKLVDKRKNE